MINKDQWHLMVGTVTNQQRSDRLQQQSLFRVFQALAQNRPRQFAEAASQVPLDLPLFFSGALAAPGADAFRPEGYAFPCITAMCWAAFRDDVDGLIVLEDAGADPAFPGLDGRDPLWLSMMGRSIRAWDHLAERTVRWDIRTVDGKRTTRLIDAVCVRHVEAVGDLIRHRVNVGAVDVAGRTALHHNFLQNPYGDEDAAIGRMLIEYGAPTDFADHEGVTPAALAVGEVQQTLIERSDLAKVAEEERVFAQAQRDHLDAITPRIQPIQDDPTDPGTPQITRPVKPKRLF